MYSFGVDALHICKGKYRGKEPFRKPFEIDGVDARSLAEIKWRRICDTLSIYFGVATTQMCRIFQKACFS